MPRTKKPVGPFDLVWVRSIYGKGPEAVNQYHFIPDGGMNQVLADWHAKQPEREMGTASPSKLLMCPRVAWLLNKGAAVRNPLAWGKAQRNLLGRQFENLFAKQLDDQKLLLHHWKDDEEDSPEKFTLGEGLDRLEGVPDYLLKIDGAEHGVGHPQEVVAISDAKTSRSDSFGYVPLHDDIWKDWGWYKYRIQLTAYYMLAQANKDWFERMELPMPIACHLFSYALDDGVVRREIAWVPTQEDMNLVKQLTRRFNQALAFPTMPDCTCHESRGELDKPDDPPFDVKFCPFGIVEPGKKFATSCCPDELEAEVAS